MQKMCIPFLWPHTIEKNIVCSAQGCDWWEKKLVRYYFNLTQICNATSRIGQLICWVCFWIIGEMPQNILSKQEMIILYLYNISHETCQTTSVILTWLSVIHLLDTSLEKLNEVNVIVDCIKNQMDSDKCKRSMR